jgi:hypothetical protein
MANLGDNRKTFFLNGENPVNIFSPDKRITYRAVTAFLPVPGQAG